MSVALDALSNSLRRHVLTQLNDSNPRDVSEFVEIEADPDGDGRPAIPIHHEYLPKLAETGFIEWDRGTDVVTRGPRFDEIAPLIDLMTNHPEELPEGWL